MKKLTIVSLMFLMAFLASNALISSVSAETLYEDLDVFGTVTIEEGTGAAGDGDLIVVDGNVGINKSSPQYPLHVYGKSQSPAGAARIEWEYNDYVTTGGRGLVVGDGVTGSGIHGIVSSLDYTGNRYSIDAFRGVATYSGGADNYTTAGASLRGNLSAEVANGETGMAYGVIGFVDDVGESAFDTGEYYLIGVAGMPWSSLRSDHTAPITGIGVFGSGPPYTGGGSNFTWYAGYFADDVKVTGDLSVDSNLSVTGTAVLDDLVLPVTTTAPTPAQTGQVYFNDSSDELCIYDGANWECATFR
jgi:hypothetical protein